MSLGHSAYCATSRSILSTDLTLRAVSAPKHHRTEAWPPPQADPAAWFRQIVQPRVKGWSEPHDAWPLVTDLENCAAFDRDRIRMW